MQKANLNLIKGLEGKMVEISRETNKGYIEEFSDEISINITRDEIILDNLYTLDDEETSFDTNPIHILQEKILEIEKGYSDEVEILTLDGLITVTKM